MANCFQEENANRSRAEYHFKHGLSAFYAEDYDIASKLFRLAIVFDSTLLDAHIWSYLALHESGHGADVADLFKRIPRTENRKAAILLITSIAEFSQGEYRSAREHPSSFSRVERFRNAVALRLGKNFACTGKLRWSAGKTSTHPRFNSSLCCGSKTTRLDALVFVRRREDTPPTY